MPTDIREEYSDILAPNTTREKTSLPKESVPMSPPTPGGCSVSA